MGTASSLRSITDAIVAKKAEAANETRARLAEEEKRVTDEESKRLLNMLLRMAKDRAEKGYSFITSEIPQSSYGMPLTSTFHKISQDKLSTSYQRVTQKLLKLGFKVSFSITERNSRWCDEWETHHTLVMEVSW